MSIWQDVATRIEEHGVRVEQRRALLEALRGHAESGGSLEALLAERQEALLDAVRRAARDVHLAERG